MPTPGELEEEDRRVRYLRMSVDLALNVIAQTDLPPADAAEMISAVRRTAVRLFPGKATTFDLIYLPRLRRLLAERYGPVACAAWSTS
jgi:hypothetical protein